MQNRRGFSLIEILVVILIIGIATGVALLAFGDFGAARKVTIAAEQFSSYIKLVQQRAILEMNTLGISVNQKGYETFRFEQGQFWQAMPKNNIFHWQAFPESMLVSLQSNLVKNRNSPDIVINPSGDMTPFRMYFGNSRQPRITVLIGQHNGDLILQQDDSP